MSAATYPVATIAKLLLLTERRVQQLTREGVLPRADRGRYELAPVVQAYVRYLRDRMLPSEAGLRRENGTATQTNEAEEEREAEPDPAGVAETSATDEHAATPRTLPTRPLRIKRQPWAAYRQLDEKRR